MTRIIIDVRERQEFKSGHVRGAVNIPVKEIMRGSSKLHGVPKDAEIILYCKSGSRSSLAIDALRAQGFSSLVNGINKQQVETRYL